MYWSRATSNYFLICQKIVKNMSIFQIFDLCILYAPYLRHYSSEFNQTLQEGSIYSEVVQRQVIFCFVKKLSKLCQKIVKIMSIFQIFDFCILNAPYLHHFSLEFNRTLQSGNIYIKVVQLQFIFRFGWKLSKLCKNCQNYIRFSNLLLLYFVRAKSPTLFIEIQSNFTGRKHV